MAAFHLLTIGSAFPMQITAKIKYACEREWIEGGSAAARERNGLAVQRDVIAGRPICCCIYDKASLSISPSSGILSSQNLSHAQSMDLIARKQ